MISDYEYKDIFWYKLRSINLYIYFIIIVNFFRFKLKKIILKGKVSVNKVEQISLFTSIKMARGSKLKLGRNVIISKYGDLFVGPQGNLEIDERVYFNKGIFISCQNHVHIGEGCQFGPDVKIIDNNHKFSKEKGVSTIEHTYGEIIIGENSWVGSNVILLKNSKIGKHCVIGAGCVINEEIPDYSIVTLDSKNIVINSIREK